MLSFDFSNQDIWPKFYLLSTENLIHLSHVLIKKYIKHITIQIQILLKLPLKWIMELHISILFKIKL